jgi:hypothetical protein
MGFGILLIGYFLAFATALAKIRALFTKKFWVGVTKIPPVNTKALVSSFKTI